MKKKTTWRTEKNMKECNWKKNIKGCERMHK